MPKFEISVCQNSKSNFPGEIFRILIFQSTRFLLPIAYFCLEETNKNKKMPCV